MQDDIYIALSQSGETEDTLACVEMAKEAGALVLGIVNTPGSSIARATAGGAYLHVGHEVGVTSTKTFTGEVMTLAMLALKIGIAKGVISDEQMLKHVDELLAVPEKMRHVLSQHDKVLYISQVRDRACESQPMGTWSGVVGCRSVP